jgi:CRISPR system Cascade subunit CasC
MTAPRFLQLHTLHSYPAALLNRDDSGLAKRLNYGGAMRTRISSQCLKRHWRMADKDPHSLHGIDGAELAFRSRDLVEKKVIGVLEGKYPDAVVSALAKWFRYAVYSGNPKEKPKKRDQLAKADEKKNRQTLLFGGPEVKWLENEFERLAIEAGDDPDKAFELGQLWVDGAGKDADAEARKGFKENIATLRKNAALPAGLTSALFGRMVTSDPAANIDAPVHVAHAFTVHAEEAEADYFTAVDDLRGDDDDSGADTIQETELTSGLFYGYVVVDLPGLISNCGRNRDLAERVVRNLVHLIAEVSPGAKLGSTAPYGYAGLVLGEAGDRQPRSLAEAFRKPVAPRLDDAVRELGGQLKRFDEAYATGEARRCTNLSDTRLDGIEAVPIAALAEWAAGQVKEAPDD